MGLDVNFFVGGCVMWISYELFKVGDFLFGVLYGFGLFGVDMFGVLVGGKY